MADVTKIETKDGNIYEVDGKRYRELSKEPVVGDMILVTNAHMTGDAYSNGDMFTVSAYQKETEEYYENISVDGLSMGILRNEFVIVEPIEQVDEPEESEFVKLFRRLTRLEERTEENHRNILTFSQMAESARSDASKAIGGVNALDEQLELVREDIVFLDEKIDELKETKPPQNITININVLDVESAKAIVESITKGCE